MLILCILLPLPAQNRFLFDVLYYGQGKSPAGQVSSGVYTLNVQNGDWFKITVCVV